MRTNRCITASIGILSAIALLAAFQPPLLAQKDHKAKVSARQAEAAALKRYKHGKLHGKTELENEDGKWQYAVMVQSRGKLHEVMVSARTGRINSEETVTPREEANEKVAEKHNSANRK